MPLQLAHLIHQRTEGNPLFMVNVVEDLLLRERSYSRRGVGTADGVEEVESGCRQSLRQMIEQQLARLSPEEQRVVEVAVWPGWSSRRRRWQRE